MMGRDESSEAVILRCAKGTRGWGAKGVFKAAVSTSRGFLAADIFSLVAIASGENDNSGFAPRVLGFIKERRWGWVLSFQRVPIWRL